MDLNSLCVIHLEKRKCTATDRLLPRLPAETFHLDSCQRQLWVSARPLQSPSPLYDCYNGEEAYGFLLRVATGLESAVAGETDIFGQLKEAWLAFSRDPRSGEVACELHPWFQNLFEDAKDIRAAHLQNLGGASYGSLVRMLLRPNRSDRILMVGAGRIIQSVAPFLVESELLLWNRTVERLSPLKTELQRVGATRLSVVETVAEELAAWKEADHVVVGVPLDHERDRRWIEARLASKGTTLHLGCLSAEAGPPWERLSGLKTLSDLFVLRETQSNVRSHRIDVARKACRERAGLRKLGRSLSIAHGWEDLAMF